MRDLSYNFANFWNSDAKKGAVARDAIHDEITIGIFGVKSELGLKAVISGDHGDIIPKNKDG